MIVGVPKEIKKDEHRVAMLPVGVHELTHSGHRVLVQKGAGLGSGISDDQYSENGAKIVEDPKEIFGEAEMIVKVKEPQESEWPMIRKGQLVFTYFHFAADGNLTKAMIDTGATAIAYETIEDKQRRLPLLTPMSEVAGRLSIQEGAKYLEKPFGGRGVLLGGVPGVQPGHVVVLGGGIVGTNAAKMAAGLGANVSLLDVSLDRLRQLDDFMPPNVTTLFSDRLTILDCISTADLVIGAVLIPGARAPRLIKDGDFKRMKAGAVIVDVAIDQGGCVDGARPTTHSNPTYMIEDVMMYCVANMPGAVARTSSYALCNVTFPYALDLAKRGFQKVMSSNEWTARGVNVHDHKVTNAAVAETFSLPYSELKIA